MMERRITLGKRIRIYLDDGIRKWNILDDCIYRVEELLHTISFSDLSEQVDVETMIEAETEHLREENEHLKSREVPLYMLQKDGMYICPKCQEVLNISAKYCSGCGHRVMRHIPLSRLEST